MGKTIAEKVSQETAGFDPNLVWKYLTGETGIDDSAQTETTAYSIMTIAPATGSPLFDCEVWIDLAKATTGFAAVESSATILFHVARKVDGTNYRIGAAEEAALSGTNAAGRMIRIKVGYVDPNYPVQIFIDMSADATSDMELPYVVAYRGYEAPTLTVPAA